MQIINLPPNFDISKVTRADLEANVGKYFRLPSGQVVHLVKDAFGTFKAVPVGGSSNIQYVLPGKDVEIWTTPDIARNFSNAHHMYELWTTPNPYAKPFEETHYYDPQEKRWKPRVTGYLKLTEIPKTISWKDLFENEGKIIEFPGGEKYHLVRQYGVFHLRPLGKYYGTSDVGLRLAEGGYLGLPSDLARKYNIPAVTWGEAIANPSPIRPFGSGFIGSGNENNKNTTPSRGSLAYYVPFVFGGAGGGGGGSVGSLIRRSLSLSGGGSLSYSGLPPMLYDMISLLATGFLGGSANFPSFVEALISGKPTGWYEAFRKQYEDLYERIKKETLAEYEKELKRMFENLARKGVLDSSVTTSAITQTTSRLLDKLLTEKSKFGIQALERGYQYPLLASRSYTGLLTGLFGLPRFSITASQSGSVSSTYDPTPYASIVGSLLSSLI